MTGSTPPRDQVRPDIAALLHEGLSDAAISRRVHVCHTTVARARAVLGIPKHRPGPRAAATPDELFWQRVELKDDGHMEWTGYGTTGVAGLRHEGKFHTAFRLAFRIANGREPEGNVQVTCGREQCVAPGHHADRADRELSARIDILHDLIFGPQPVMESEK
ncbi:hypothetical protein ACIQI8_27250 [Streptomyces sp. NPDC092369]|uniref:hypothetical protein n=1 Tax=Streptomyces sp. NPDC092369 TaxID=3366015 RepID=UPI0037FF3B39